MPGVVVLAGWPVPPDAPVAVEPAAGRVDEPAVGANPVAAEGVDVDDEVVVLVVDAETGGVWGWRKTTVSVPVEAGCWTWTSATKLEGRFHGSLPPGAAVPAIWVTLPRNR